MPDIVVLSISAAAVGASWILYSIAYNLWLSPLARFPGPRLWAISKIPSQLSVLRGRTHLDITALHERYGSVIRLNENELAFNTAQAFKDIYGFRPGGCFPKDRSHYMPPANGVDHLVCAVDNAVHARHRRLLAHAFSDRVLREQEGLITGYIDILIGKLKDLVRAGESDIDIRNWLNYTAFDITGDLMFGESFNCLRDSQLHPWIVLIFNSIKALSLMGAVAQFPLLQKLLDRLIPKKVKQQSLDHFNLSADKVDRRLEKGASRPDFMSAILQNGLSDKPEQHNGEERVMSRAEIHSNAFILIVAGSETSATHLCGCLYYLCQRPEIMTKLVHEVRSTFTADNDITFNKLATLPYLAAVIEETLRCYPPFVTSLARVSPPGGAMVDGHFVPENTIVACHHYASYHSSSNFYLPDEFIPERWLGSDPRFDGDKREVLQPFSLGPRNCLGKNLAYCEIRMILCKILYNFDIKLSPKCLDWINQDVYFFWDKPPLIVELKEVVH